ncbi:unnamed protein product [Meganyctiphanes norvegica]|uniref:Uncharacterized protein n=1 Tax=Meganyctiphanes norvegica TaxID=48144 RepID=A0AAV2R236_MEGNR
MYIVRSYLQMVFLPGCPPPRPESGRGSKFNIESAPAPSPMKVALSTRMSGYRELFLSEKKIDRGRPVGSCGQDLSPWGSWACHGLHHVTKWCSQLQNCDPQSTRKFDPFHSFGAEEASVPMGKTGENWAEKLLLKTFCHIMA